MQNHFAMGRVRLKMETGDFPGLGYGASRRFFDVRREAVCQMFFVDIKVDYVILIV